MAADLQQATGVPEDQADATVASDRVAPRVVLVGDRRADETQGMVHDIEAAPAQVVASAWYGDEALQAVAELSPDAVVVDLAASIDAAIQTLRELTSIHPALAIVVLPPDGGELAARSLVVSDRIEIVAKPLRPWTVAAALGRLLADAHGGDATEHRKAAPRPLRGRVIAVIGAKGGVGTTTFAVNLGMALRAAAAGRVSLVDLNVDHGDVALATDIVPARSITDLAREGDRLDPDLVASYFTRHGSGLRVLPAPPRPTRTVVDPTTAKRIVAMTAAQSDFVILDLPRGFAPLQRAVLQTADWVLVVISNEVGSLKNGRVLLGALNDLDKGPNQLQIVLNHVARGHGLSKRDCERTLGRRVFSELPHEKAHLAAWTEGRPVMELARGSKYSQSVRKLARMFVPTSKRRSARHALSRLLSRPKSRAERTSQ